jgi:hypothetical protein
MNLNWTTDHRVPALLQSVRDTPPTKHWFKQPSNSSLFGRDDVFNYVHPALTELKAIHNEYFTKLNPLEKEQGYDAYRAAALAFFADYPTPEQIVAGVVS